MFGRVIDMTETARRLMPRTEAEWLACNDPLPMLESLRAKASDTNVLLCAVSCSRFTLADPTPDRSRRALARSWTR
jgi:hypothetical protein